MRASRLWSTFSLLTWYQEWTDGFFKKVTLLHLALVVPLGDHDTNSPCGLSQRKRIVVLHTNGVHEVNVSICGCRLNLDVFRQLLRVSWYPATPLQPETCATVDLLELFHSTNLQGNLTVYDFVKSLEYLTDGWRLEDLPVSNALYMLSTLRVVLTPATLGPSPTVYHHGTRVA